MFDNKHNNPINRVKCVVNTCKHYMSGDQCSAENILVEPQNAADSQETDCGTFVKRS